MRTAPPMAREKLLELLRLTPEPHMREGYVMALRNAVDEFVRAILHDVDTMDESPSRTRSEPLSTARGGNSTSHYRNTTN